MFDRIFLVMKMKKLLLCILSLMLCLNTSVIHAQEPESLMIVAHPDDETIWGGMSNQVFLLAFHELIIMWPVAFILEYFFVDKLAHYFAFKVVTPKDRPFFITLAISFYIICIMCPIMSLIATILFKTPGVQIISVWFMTILFNFPMAFFWQICYCGPFVRWIFGKLFH